MDLNSIDLKTYEECFVFNMLTEYITTTGDIFEFGTYGGNALRDLISQLEDKQIKYRKIFTFDSFCGLPNECEDSGRPFEKGHFNAQNLYNTNNINEIKRKILQKTKNIPIIIEGFYEQTLTKQLILEHDIQPASYISMDCDLYSSTCIVLEWIFSNNLFLNGTIIRYDDWFSDTLSGEEKAHIEMCQKYKIGNEIVFEDMIEAKVFKIWY